MWVTILKASDYFKKNKNNLLWNNSKIYSIESKNNTKFANLFFNTSTHKLISFFKEKISYAIIYAHKDAKLQNIGRGYIWNWYIRLLLLHVEKKYKILFLKVLIHKAINRAENSIFYSKELNNFRSRLAVLLWYYENKRLKNSSYGFVGNNKKIKYNNNLSLLKKLKINEFYYYPENNTKLTLKNQNIANNVGIFDNKKLYIYQGIYSNMFSILNVSKDDIIGYDVALDTLEYDDYVDITLSDEDSFEDELGIDDIDEDFLDENPDILEGSENWDDYFITEMENYYQENDYTDMFIHDLHDQEYGIWEYPFIDLDYLDLELENYEEEELLNVQKHKKNKKKELLKCLV